MNLTFALLALVILGSAAVAVTLRNLIHSALLLVLSWLGVAAFYLWAGAEFIAFAQVLVYVGAISMVVLFAVLLTGRSRAELILEAKSSVRIAAAVFASAAVFAVLATTVMQTDFSTPLTPAPAAAPTLTVRSLGLELMGPHVAAVLVIGALLTVALLGAIVLASSDEPTKGDAP